MATLATQVKEQAAAQRQQALRMPPPARGYGPGMWAWLLQRVTGVLMFLLVFAHFWAKVIVPARGPIHMAVDLALIVLVAYHGFNGIRITLIDLGLGIRLQRAIFWSIVVLTVVTAAMGLREYVSWYL